jgi:hypothetical protein
MINTDCVDVCDNNYQFWYVVSQVQVEANQVEIQVFRQVRKLTWAQVRYQVTHKVIDQVWYD